MTRRIQGRKRFIWRHTPFRIEAWQELKQEGRSRSCSFPPCFSFFSYLSYSTRLPWLQRPTYIKQQSENVPHPCPWIMLIEVILPSRFYLHRCVKLISKISHHMLFIIEPSLHPVSSSSHGFGCAEMQRVDYRGQDLISCFSLLRLVAAPTTLNP